MNKGSSSIKTIIVVVVLVLVGVLGVLGINTAKTYMSGAAGGCEPKSLKASPAEDGKSAVISWETDKECLSLVKYGMTPAGLLLTATEQSEGTSHRLSLSPLKQNSMYYYHVEVGDQVFENTDGIPFNFKTGGKAEQKAAPTVALLPSPSPAVSGTCDRTSDYNQDGKVNSFDYLHCNSSKSSQPTGQLSATPTKAGAINCNNPGDFDKNGVINSIDRLKCLQSTSR